MNTQKPFPADLSAERLLAIHDFSPESSLELFKTVCATGDTLGMARVLERHEGRCLFDAMMKKPNAGCLISVFAAVGLDEPRRALAEQAIERAKDQLGFVHDALHYAAAHVHDQRFIKTLIGAGADPGVFRKPYQLVEDKDNQYRRDTFNALGGAIIHSNLSSLEALLPYADYTVTDSNAYMSSSGLPAWKYCVYTENTHQKSRSSDYKYSAIEAACSFASPHIILKVAAAHGSEPIKEEPNGTMLMKMVLHSNKLAKSDFEERSAVMREIARLSGMRDAFSSTFDWDDHFTRSNLLANAFRNLDAVFIRELPQAVASYKNKYGDRAFHLLVSNIDHSTVEKLRGSYVEHVRPFIDGLISAGADINARNGSGRTALHELTLKANPSNRPFIVAMTQAGADPTIKDDRGWSSISEVSRRLSREKDAGDKAFLGDIKGLYDACRAHASIDTALTTQAIKPL